MGSLVSGIVPALIGAGIILLLTLVTGGSLRGRKAGAQGGGCAGCSCDGECTKQAKDSDEG